jgi:hypothetical protein
MQGLPLIVRIQIEPEGLLIELLDLFFERHLPE